MTSPASFAEQLASMPFAVREKALSQLGDEKAKALRYQWRGFWARPNQIAPDGDWDIWLVLAGRGGGKTRMGAEWIREQVEAGARRIALVAETAADARDVMVEGASGLLSVYPPEERPHYEPSKRRVTWANGAVATLYNGTEPDQLRGPQHDAAWVDELAKFRYAQDAWDQLQFGMRLGAHPRIMISTTPRAIPIVRDLMKRAAAGDGVVVTRFGTMENRSNLAATFRKAVVDRYAGTRLGRQELDAEVLDDVPGALWTRKVLDDGRVPVVPALKRIVVAVDPAASSEETSEEPGENGIVAAGLGQDGRGYVLDDASLVGSPDAWARRAVTTLDRFEGDAVIVEENQGGDMVEHVLRSVRPTLKIVRVRATRGKHVRAEPIAALYEQGRVSHHGTFAALEDQMMLCTAQGYLGDRSPDRLDALVWAMTELFPAMIKPERPVQKQARPQRVAGGLGWMR